MFLFFIPAVLLLAGLLYQSAGRALDTRRLPAPGRLVRCSCGTLHIHKQGMGSPAVVLEAGISGTSLGWAIVQPKIAEFTTVCSYDRLGLGWSSSGKRARTVANMTGELRELLSQAGIPPPYVLVGHSFGGLLVRAFAATYPDQTAGLVLVDPVSIASWSACSEADRRRLNRGVSFSRRGAWLARFGVVRFALYLLVSGARWLPNLIGRAAAPGASSFMNRIVGQVRRLPKEVWPAIQSHWSDPKCFAGMATYLAALPACAQQAEALKVPEEIPQTILSAGTATSSELAERDRWAAGQPATRHVHVAQSGHWIQLEEPGVVIEAVREMVQRAGVKP